MNKKLVLLLPLLLVSLTSCKSHEHDNELVVTNDSEWHTFIKGQDFKNDGLQVGLKCKTCGQIQNVDYEVVNGSNLAIDQTSVTIKSGDYILEYGVKVKEEYRIACLGDSLTYGHMWRNQAYPVYLSQDVSNEYTVGNFSYNGLSITGYGGSFKNPDERYILRDEYKQSLAFEPDIIAIMLGTNDATEWSKAEPSFEEEYRTLLDSYLELFPDVQIIMMVSPPVISPNQFDIPNAEINDYVNPIQRDLAAAYGFEILDLREEFEEVEDYQTKYLRPNDGVHFTEEGAKYVASRVWDIAKDLRF